MILLGGMLLIQSQMTAQIFPNLGGQRSGISALQFLKLGVGARGAAMGESFIATANDASALYWNPAGVVEVPSNSVILYHAEWLVDMKHDYAGILYRLSPADVLGLSVTSLTTDEMKVTDELHPTGNGLNFKFSDVALGVTYSRKMTDQFSFGATLKYVQETIDIVKIKAFLFDLGTYYSMGIGSARFGVVVTNFGADVAPEGTVTLLNGNQINSFQPFSPPTAFKLAVAFEPYEDELNRLTTNVQLNHPNDNAENVRLGLEYAFDRWLFLRGGVKRTIGEPLFGDDRKSADLYSLGAGVYIPFGFTDATFDYAYTDYGILGSVHRLSFTLTY